MLFGVGFTYVGVFAKLYFALKLLLVAIIFLKIK